jgi:uncharacterized SAM-binding protein YcdF (DUF218 family)
LRNALPEPSHVTPADIPPRTAYRWGYRWTIWLFGVVVVLTVLVALAVLAFIHLGSWLAAPAGAPVSADAIIVLGGDGGARVIEGGRLYREGVAPWVVITGMEESPDQARKQYLDWRVKVLEDNGVPHAAVREDRRSRNSWDEALHTRELMRQMQWKRVLVVSDPPHMRRLLWTWRRAFAFTDLEFVLIAVDTKWWHPDGWWKDEASGRYVANEVIKLAYYIATK